MNFQKTRNLAALAILLVCLVPLAGQAAIQPYSQDFEGLVQTDTGALAADGWVVYGNVFTPLGVFMYGYGAFPAPNDGAAFCQIDVLQGGVEQGAQQLVVFSDYNNVDHANGDLIESNVYHEMTIEEGDVGKTWKFAFQAKLGNLVAPSTAAAFLKTLNPAAGYATTNFVTADMTTIPDTWGDYSLSLTIDASLVGQLFQFGFTNTATLYESSAVFYDNIVFAEDNISAVPDGSVIAGAVLHQNVPNPFNPMTDIAFSLDKPGLVEITVYDVAGRRIVTLQQGAMTAGDHRVTWDGKSATGVPAAAGLYNYVLKTASGQVSRHMTLLK